MSIRTVEPLAGAMWVVNGVKLWWRDLRGLGFLGLLLGLVGISPNLAAVAAPQLAMPVQLLSLLGSALIVVALFYAAREVDEGRSATPAQLQRALQTGNTGKLVAGVLLPQLAVLMICGMLLVWIVGLEDLEKLAALMQDMQAGKPMPQPAALAALPIGRFMLWFAAAGIVLVIIGMLTFTLLPDMIFGGTPFFSALRRSVGVCLNNLPAMIVFALTMLFLCACMLGLMGPISLFLLAVLGPVGASLAINVLFVAVLVPISTNALYLGWKQLLGTQSDSVAPPTDRVAM